MPVPLLMPAALAIAREFLPGLAQALRRPGGSVLAERVVDAAAAAAGVSPASDPQQIIARVKENPDAVQDLQLELEQLETDKEIYLAEIADRDKARVRELGRGDDARQRGNWMIAGVSLGLIACVGGAIWGMKLNLSDGVLALITTVSGALLKMLSDAFAYEFGSSRGSREKSAEILEISRSGQQATARAVENAQTQTATITSRIAQATTQAITTGAAAATVVAETVTPKPRDFVGQLVRGEI